jgi:hypothetical protein
MKRMKEKNEGVTDEDMKDGIPVEFQRDFPLNANIILKMTLKDEKDYLFWNT